MKNTTICEEGCSLPSSSNELPILLKQLQREVKELMETTTARLLTQDGKIAETCVYLKNNLSNELRSLFDSMIASGEIDQIILNIFQSEIDSKASKTTVNTHETRITNLENNKLDRNKNESITYAMLSQEVKQNITGGNTAVVGINSVNTSNIVDGSVTLSKLNADTKKQIYKNNVLLNGSLTSVSYDQPTSTVSVSYDRSYLYIQSDSAPLHVTIPAGSCELGTTEFLVVKMSDLGTTGAEIVPTVLDNSTSRRDLFNGDYIILLSNQYGRLGGLFAQNVLSLTNSTDINASDDQVYLKVNSETSLTLLKKCSESSNSYLGMDFIRSTDSSKNSDIWRIQGVRKYIRNSDDFISSNIYFVTTGEIESAIKINGASDFVGGSIHGYEEFTNLEIYIDGKKINTSTPGAYSGNSIVINRISNMYDYGTKNIFAIHNCMYEFTSNDLTLTQNIDFKMNKLLDKSYLGMYPIARKEGDNYISNKGVLFPNLINVDLYENHTNISEYENINSIIISNQEELGHHFIGKLEILDKNVPSLKMSISNSEFYNKIYPDVCGDSYNVKTNDVWFIKSKFVFDYKGLSN